MGKKSPTLAFALAIFVFPNVVQECCGSYNVLPKVLNKQSLLMNMHRTN